MKMFCRQCEQTAKSESCTIHGVCGKSPETAALQDLLIHVLIALGVVGKAAADVGIKDREADRFIQEGLFTTVTNVNFDAEKIATLIRRAHSLKTNLVGRLQEKQSDALENLADIINWVPAKSTEELITQGSEVGILANPDLDKDIRSLREILLYGLKGMAAYADHAAILGKEDDGVNAFFYKGLSALVNDTLSADDLVALIMEFGKVNFRCLEILDEVHNMRFGSPVPTKVSLGLKKGLAIIISGHDLLDLEQLLQQTQGTGINVYTHGEMLTAHSYPGLNKYSHLVGHYGSAWQNQQKEFDALPASILMTTNCIQKPQSSYLDRIFTTGLVAWPGVNHINANNGSKDFSKVIERAKELGGFNEDCVGKEITIGFGHGTVLSLAGKVVEAVKSGAIKHFFLIGGCDGAKPGRNYFTEFAQKTPADTIILTLACGKFRFNTLDFGTIGEFPRLLDCGQCNDAYSAIKIALALADAFKCSVNDLPLSIILSWYEQKAVCILLTLFSLGVKNIKLGPSLPAFISPNVLNILVEKFAIKPITTADADLKEILGQKIKA